MSRYGARRNGVCPGKKGGHSLTYYIDWGNSPEHWPEYLPESLFMNIAVGLKEWEPNFIYLSFAGKPDNRENASHILNGNCVSVVSKVKLKTKADEYSDTLLYMIQASDLEVEADGEEILEIELDGSVNGKEKDFQPLLPLRIKW